MTTKPATSTAKPAKNKLLSIYNRVMGLTLILVIAAAITFGVLANKYRTQARSMSEQAATATAEAIETRANTWCSSISASNAEAIPQLYDDYKNASEQLRQSIDSQCTKRVTTAVFMTTYTPDEIVKLTDECNRNADSTVVTCSGTAELYRDKADTLTSFSNTTVVLTIEFSTDETRQNVTHVDKDVVTLTVPTDGNKLDYTFDLPYDAAWGAFYKITPQSFFPNE